MSVYLACEGQQWHVCRIIAFLNGTFFYQGYSIGFVVIIYSTNILLFKSVHFVYLILNGKVVSHCCGIKGSSLDFDLFNSSFPPI